MTKSFLQCALLWGWVTPVAGTDGDIPGQQWERVAPEEVGLCLDRLEKLAEEVGGNGCVVSGGRMAYEWGNPRSRKDVKSVGKVLFSTFLFRALEEEKIASLEEKVVRYRPGLTELNAEFLSKDAHITWEHLANQTACYGSPEFPGTAFDYNDWGVALFAELLFEEIYGVTKDNVDEKLLHPLLIDILQCQDKPTLQKNKTYHYRLDISMRDLARVGLLFLRKGSWGDRQVLDSEIVMKVTGEALSPLLPRTRGGLRPLLEGQTTFGGANNMEDHLGSYGWMWWKNIPDRDGARIWPALPVGACAAIGQGGVFVLMVIADRDMVVTWASDRTAPTFHSENGRQILNDRMAIFLEGAQPKP